MSRFLRTIIFLFLFYSLGYTHFLGGPYWFFRFIFVITIVGMIFTILFFWRVKVFSRRVSIKTDHQYDGNNETIKVDAKIIE
ncbi:MAG: hypothetical protein WCI41_02160 [bacterium]